MKKNLAKWLLLFTIFTLSVFATSPVWAAQYIRPIDNGHITTGFNGYAGHTGVDYAAGTGVPIRAVADGTVKFAGPGSQHSWMSWQAGNCVLIQHADGMHSGYAHMSRVATTTGARVRQGDVIGYVGATGNVTGPHLHFEFLPAVPNFRNGRAGRIDPTGLIAHAPTFTGRPTTQAIPALKIYRVDDLQRVNGVWLVRNNSLAPADFAWRDNGIPVSEIDEVDANGRLTSDQVLQKGGYFVFNLNRVSSVGISLRGSGGYYWAQTRFANGRVVWLRTDNRNQLIYR